MLNTRDRRLYLHGVGHLKVRLHRALRGVPKTCHVRREGRRWCVVIQCADVPARPLARTGRVVGIDLGITHLATTSDGEHLVNDRPAARAAARLAHAQQALARAQRRSGRRRRAVERVAACHRTIANQRRDQHHKLSRRLVDQHDVIVHERLQITNMCRSAAGTLAAPGTNVAAKRGLNRSIHDAGWGQLLRMLAYKAEEAGRTVIAVDTRGSSQRCACCGHREPGNRPTQAEFRCQSCGHADHADINAARNILWAGLAQHPAGCEAETRAS